MTKTAHFLKWSTASLLALIVAGCAGGTSSREPVGLTGSIERQSSNKSVPRNPDDEEAPRPVPPDPYKNVNYTGGRDPVTGVAPDLDGHLPENTPWP